MKRLLLIPILMSSVASAEQPSEFDCLMEPHVVVNVTTAVRGKIKTMNVERSDFVKQGQVLAELESNVEKAAADIAQARTELEAEIKSSRTSLKYSTRKLGRFDGLYEEEVVSAQTKDEVETEVVLARLQVMQAMENKRLAELEHKRALAILDQRTVFSPISGVVVDRYSSAGEYADDEALMQLAQLDPLNIEVILPASRFGTIKPGMQATVSPESPLDGTYKAEVKIVDSVVDASSGTFGVRLELPNPDNKLPGGLNCKVSFSGNAPAKMSGTPDPTRLSDLGYSQ